MSRARERTEERKAEKAAQCLIHDRLVPWVQEFVVAAGKRPQHRKQQVCNGTCAFSKQPGQVQECELLAEETGLGNRDAQGYLG